MTRAPLSVTEEADGREIVVIHPGVHRKDELLTLRLGPPREAVETVEELPVPVAEEQLEMFFADVDPADREALAGRLDAAAFDSRGTAGQSQRREAEKKRLHGTFSVRYSVLSASGAAGLRLPFFRQDFPSQEGFVKSSWKKAGLLPGRASSFEALTLGAAPLPSRSGNAPRALSQFPS